MWKQAVLISSFILGCWGIGFLVSSTILYLLLSVPLCLLFAFLEIRWDDWEGKQDL